MRVVVDSGTGFVVEVAYTDDFGTRTQTRFSGHEGQAIEDPAVFVFQAPPGAEVIEI